MLKWVLYTMGCAVWIVSSKQVFLFENEFKSQESKTHQLELPSNHYHHESIVVDSVTFSCPYYSVSNTNYAYQNYASCSFIACGGTAVTISGCNACSGDQYIQVYSGSQYITSNDDGCSACSLISFTSSGTPSTCPTYTIREGCYSTNSCSGTVTVTGSVNGQVPSPLTTHTPVYDDGITITSSPLNAGSIAAIVICVLFCGGGGCALVIFCFFCAKAQSNNAKLNEGLVTATPTVTPNPLTTSPTYPQEVNNVNKTVSPEGYYANNSTAYNPQQQPQQQFYASPQQPQNLQQVYVGDQGIYSGHQQQQYAYSPHQIQQQQYIPQQQQQQPAYVTGAVTSFVLPNGQLVQQQQEQQNQDGSTGGTYNCSSNTTTSQQHQQDY